MRDKYQNTGFNKVLNKLRAERILSNSKGKVCLEAGCGEGQITKYLAQRFEQVDVIDIDEALLQYVAKSKNVSITCTPIEDFVPTTQPDTVVCTNVLEHVDNPVEVLKHMRTWGNNDTVYFFSVPNARSINRIVGVDIGMLDYPEQLGPHDIDTGHKRVYNLRTLTNHIKKAGFKIIESGSMVYKPLPNELMEKLHNSVLKQCLSLPVFLYGAELYVVATL